MMNISIYFFLCVCVCVYHIFIAFTIVTAAILSFICFVLFVFHIKKYTVAV